MFRRKICWACSFLAKVINKLSVFLFSKRLSCFHHDVFIIWILFFGKSEFVFSFTKEALIKVFPKIPTALWDQCEEASNDANEHACTEEMDNEHACCLLSLETALENRENEDDENKEVGGQVEDFLEERHVPPAGAVVEQEHEVHDGDDVGLDVAREHFVHDEQQGQHESFEDEQDVEGHHVARLHVRDLVELRIPSTPQSLFLL